jgi:hypothetical protein
MRGFIIAASAAVAAADGMYQVEYTPSVPKLDSATDVSITLGTVSGTSSPVVLGQAFQRGTTETQYLSIPDVEGITNHVQVNSEDWGGINFITVVSPNAQVSQFKTDYFTANGAPHSDSDGTHFYDHVYSSTQETSAPLLEDPHAYTLKWKTGYHDNSGSLSPMYVQLEGDQGKSRYYLIDSSFSPGHAAERNLGVYENIGSLQSIDIVAGGGDSWNPINFLEVVTPGSETVQFQVNAMLDQLPESANPEADYGVYAHSESVQAVAVGNNFEGTSTTPRTYQVSYETGTHDNAGSTNPQYIQFQGESGESNFLKLGDSFVAGERVVVDVQTAHEFGLLTHVELLAGGTDGWNVVGDLEVRTPSQADVHFQTDLYLDGLPHSAGALYGNYPYYVSHTIATSHPEPPHPCSHTGQLNCCGNGICDATEDVGNCPHDCVMSGVGSNAWGTPEVATTTTSTATPFDADDASHVLQACLATATTDESKSDCQQAFHEAALYHGVDTAALLATVHPGDSPAPAPKAPYDTSEGVDGDGNPVTISPTTDALQRAGCTMGEGEDATEVPHGWTMPGTGNNYCNYCGCTDGEVACTSKACGVPFGGEIPTGWSVCTAEEATCHYNTTFADPRVVVHSSHANSLHRCAYNQFSEDCLCYCQSTHVDYNTIESGQHAFISGWQGEGTVLGAHCESVDFELPFDETKGPVHTVVSVGHTTRITPVHDATIAWVEQSTSTSFIVCAREDLKYHNDEDTHDHRLVINYVAYQGGDLEVASKPFGGARSAQLTVPAANAGGVHCQDVSFGEDDAGLPRPFDSTPIVIGSVDHNEQYAHTHHAVNHWIDVVNHVQFRVCFRESAHADDGWDAFNFNWFAFESHGRSYRIPGSGYDTSGIVSTADSWARPDDYEREDDDQVGYLACKWIDFDVVFTQEPTILVTGTHQAHGLDWAAEAQHKATITYVNKATSEGMEVCSTCMFVEGVNATDTDLEWSYVAFGAHTGNVSPPPSSPVNPQTDMSAFDLPVVQLAHGESEAASPTTSTTTLSPEAQGEAHRDLYDTLMASSGLNANLSPAPYVIPTAPQENEADPFSDPYVLENAGGPVTP